MISRRDFMASAIAVPLVGSIGFGQQSAICELVSPQLAAARAIFDLIQYRWPKILGPQPAWFTGKIQCPDDIEKVVIGREQYFALLRSLEAETTPKHIAQVAMVEQSDMSPSEFEHFWEATGQPMVDLLEGPFRMLLDIAEQLNMPEFWLLHCQVPDDFFQTP